MGFLSTAFSDVKPSFRGLETELVQSAGAQDRVRGDTLASDRRYDSAYQGQQLGLLDQLLFGVQAGQNQEDYVDYRDSKRVSLKSGQRPPENARFIRKRSGGKEVWEIGTPRQRTVDIQSRRGIMDMLGQGVQSSLDADPAQAQLREQLNQTIMQRLSSPDQLTPYERKQLVQDIRGAQAGRGFGYSPRDIDEEAISMYLANDQRRQQTLGNAFQLGNYNRMTSGLTGAQGVLSFASGLNNQYQAPNINPFQNSGVFADNQQSKERIDVGNKNASAGFVSGLISTAGSLAGAGMTGGGSLLAGGLSGGLPGLGWAKGAKGA